MGWKSEIARSALKKALPFQPGLRRLKRRIFPCSLCSADHRIAIEHGIKLIKMLRACDFDVSGKLGLEVGTGWVPTVPIVHLLCGAERLYLTDVVRYLDAQTLDLAKKNIQLHVGLIKEELGISKPVIDRVIAESVLQEGRLQYLAPVRWNTISAGSVDYVFSRAVLEHVPRGHIPELLAAASRVLKPGGLMAHIIDNSDHFQHNDKSISRINFLSYSSKAWSIICALADQPNRLRHSDYRRIFQSAGLSIAYEETCVDEDALGDLRKMPLDAEFMRYDPKDLACLTSCFVLKKPD